MGERGAAARLPGSRTSAGLCRTGACTPCRRPAAPVHFYPMAARTRVVWLGVADQHVIDPAPPLGQLLVQRAHVQAAELLWRGAGRGAGRSSRWGGSSGRPVWASAAPQPRAAAATTACTCAPPPAPPAPSSPPPRTVGRVHQRRLVGAKDEVGVVRGALRRRRGGRGVAGRAGMRCTQPAARARAQGGVQRDSPETVGAGGRPRRTSTRENSMSKRSRSCGAAGRHMGMTPAGRHTRLLQAAQLRGRGPTSGPRSHPPHHAPSPGCGW